MLPHSHHSLHFSFVGQRLKLMDLYLSRLHQQHHRVGGGLCYGTHEAGVVLDLSPLCEGGPRPLVPRGSRIALQGDLENFECLCQGGVGSGSK